MKNRARKKRYIVRDFRKIIVRTSTAHRWRRSKKKPCPQYEKQQIQRPVTTFSNLCDKIAVPRRHDLFFHFFNMHQTHARARKCSKTRLRHFKGKSLIQVGYLRHRKALKTNVLKRALPDFFRLRRALRRMS